MCKIINLSLSSKYPDKCKTAKVKPLYKKGTNTEPKNYRPVSLLPILSKVLERVVHNQLVEHLEKYEILFEYQSGFRSKHSVNTCLAHLSNQILKGFETGQSTGMILIDLQKAFDTLDHDILLRKMKYLGFSSKTIGWFDSYLKNRIIIVSLDKTLSDKGELNCGVPQGSILGPILFLLYVNDMKTALNNCDLRLYADDTCILFSHRNVEIIEKNLNSDFNNLCEWFVDNKLSIHFGEDKTKSILFNRGNNSNLGLNITRNENLIKQHSVVEYLGCLLDENMSGETMAKKVLKKVNGRMKFLYRQSRYLSYPLKRMLCNTLIQPHYDFACCSWYPNLSMSLKTKLQTAQNSCIRYCLGLEDRTHIGKKEFEKINWLPVSNRVNQCLAVTAYNFKNNFSPKYMNDIFSLRAPTTFRTRKSFDSLIQPFFKKEISRKSIAYLGSKIWNDLNQDIKTSPSTNSFKHALKKNFFKS